jgi:hypothetical protein
VLSLQRWRHIVDGDFGHPEMIDLRREVLEAVRARPASPGHEENEGWFYKANVGPIR